MLEDLWIIFEKPIIFLMKVLRIILIIAAGIFTLGIFIDFSARHTPKRIALVLFTAALAFGLHKITNILDGKEELHPQKTFEIPEEAEALARTELKEEDQEESADQIALDTIRTSMASHPDASDPEQNAAPLTPDMDPDAIEELLKKYMDQD